MTKDRPESTITPPNKALQPTPLGVGSIEHAPCGAAELGR